MRRHVRHGELMSLRARIEAARRGDGGRLQIAGPAGIGKSALLAEVLAGLRTVADCGPDPTDVAGVIDVTWQVVRIHGAEDEMTMPWAGLSQLALGLRSTVPALSAPQQRSIQAVTNPGDVPAPEPSAVATSVHTLVTQAAETGPVLVVIEDEHWLDPDSARVLEFVARRLDGVRALLLTTTRNPDPRGEHLDLAPLDIDAATELLIGLQVTPLAAHQLATEIGGLPLALVHAARSLTTDQRAGVDPLPNPFPLGAADLPTALSSAVNELPEASRRALHMLATAGAFDGSWPDITARAGIALSTLEAAEGAGVISIEPGAVRFTHPLFRAAVYANATPAQRRAHHRFLAEQIADPGHALWHRARAVVQHDDDVAEQLAAFAAAASAAGAKSTAFEAWHRAGELSSDASVAHRHRVAAAAAALAAGNVGPARDVVADHPPMESADPRLVRLAASLEALSGRADTAFDLFLHAAELLAPDFPDEAAQSLIDAARMRIRVGQVFHAAGAIDRLEPMLGAVREPAVHEQHRILRAFVDAVVASDAGPFVEACRALLPESGPLTGDLSFLADTVALGLAFFRHREESLALVERLRGAAADSNLPSTIPLLDTAKACALSAIDLPGGLIAAANAVEWASAIGQPNLATAALGYLANMQAALGDPGALASADRLEAVGTEQSWMNSAMVRGFYWLTMGQPDAVVRALRPLHDWTDGQMRTVLFWQGDLGEAAARTGDTELARAVADQLRDFHAAFNDPWLEGAHARVEGMIAGVDDCGPWFERSCAAFRTAGILLAEARSELLWGERLRRARRRAEARGHLQAAHAIFERIGAGRWMERCEQELLACGGASSPSDHTRDAERVLTPHELQVARLSIEGRSMREIGATMFISPRTVETHLGVIYRKLGVRNRAGLAAAAHHDPALRTGRIA